MSVRARRMRNVAVLIALGLLLTGAVAGEDDHFPFGPFRMYATATKTTGAVSFPVLEGVTTGGEEVRLLTRQVGLRRAELEGQLRLAPDRQTLLAGLADSYHRFQPDAPRLVELRLIRVSRHIDGGRMTHRSERVTDTYRVEPHPPAEIEALGTDFRYRVPRVGGNGDAAWRR